MTGEILGGGHGEVSQISFLGRCIKWTSKGYEYETDEKHAKILMEEWAMDNSRAVTSPGAAAEKADFKDKREEEEELDVSGATTYRRAAARLNYMALDRADLAYASKEASRGMAKPTKGDVVRLKRILRYLKGSPKVVNQFHFQGRQSKLVTYTDSDWAGCVKTRKSTSGGAMMLGKHLIHHWSSTQATVALSSAEAELNGIVKAISESIGIKNVINFMGRDIEVEVRTDSSAAKGIVHRTGCGKIKHLEARQLWVQDVVEKKETKVIQVSRTVNFADALTHHWSACDGYQHLSNLGLSWR